MIFFNFFTRYSAEYGLPFGTCDLYFRKEDDGLVDDCLDPRYGEKRKGGFVKEPQLVPIRRDLLDHTAGNFDREESIFAQFMVEVCYPEAVAVCSDFHAGEGQLPLGRTKWKADLTLLLPGGERKSPVVGHDRQRLIRAPSGKKTLLFVNYHGFYHFKKCNDGHKEGCKKYRGKKLEFNQKTKLQDRDMKAYAAEMSKVLVNLDFEYIASSPCDWFHGNPLPCTDESLGTSDPREYLRKLKSERVILGRKYKKGLSESRLLEEIDAEKATGFVTIEGGRETINDNASRLFAFCHTRGTQSLEELGSEAVRLAKEREPTQSEDLIQKNLAKKVCSTNVTFTRRHFEGLHTMSTQYFNFLRKRRGLKDFKIVHFIHYEIRKFLSPWVVSMLQHRWEIKKGFYKGSRGCSELALKIILNALYGYRYASCNALFVAAAGAS